MAIKKVTDSLKSDLTTYPAWCCLSQFLSHFDP